jgi:hypothetical protein
MFRLFISVAMMLVLLPLPLVAETAGAQVVCNQMVTANVYAAGADVLSQCGFTRYPLQSVSTNADGMRVYTYLVNGDEVTHTVPPTGFDFATATARQLAELHVQLPSRPSDPAGQTAWTNRMQHLTVAASPPFLASNGVRAGITTRPWSGYMNTSTYNQYSIAYIDYYESSTTSTCTGDALAEWTGLGGYYTGNLAQAGTFPHVNGVADHQDWFLDLYPNSGSSVSAVYGALIAHGGDRMQVQVNYNSGPGAPDFDMQVYDVTTNTLDVYAWSASNWDGRTAEYIAERPVVNSVQTPMRNFGTWYVNAGQTGALGAMYGLQIYPWTTIASVNSTGQVIATPDPSPSGQSFHDYWQRCG